MALFSWLSKKRDEPESSLPSEASSSPHSQPSRPGSAAHAGSHRQERSERRELLSALVTETMTQVGVLSSTYKFKVLALDAQGHEFVVMMDVPLQQVQDPARLAEIEALIARQAKARQDLLVTAVYWRAHDHVTVGVSPQALSMPRPATARPAAPAPAAPPAQPAAVVPPPPAAASGALADEIQAFRKAMADGTHVSTAKPRDQGPADFADTVVQDIDPPAR